jgi:chitinase
MNWISRLGVVSRKDEENGFASATSAWLLLANKGSQIGGTRRGTIQKTIEDDNSDDSLGCDVQREFKDLEELANASGSISQHCLRLFGFSQLSKMLDNALDKYSSSKDNEYNDLFQFYIKAFRKAMEQQLGDFMEPKKHKGIEYFSCTVNDADTDCGSSNWYQKMSKRPIMKFHIKDEQKFLSSLQNETGIEPSWIEFKEKVGGVVGTGTSYGSGVPVIGSSGTTQLIFAGYPVLKESYEVPNPKEIFDQATLHAEDLQLRIESTEVEMALGYYGGKDEDALSVYSVPVFLLTQAIENIEKVKKIGRDVKTEERKELVLEVLGAVFSVVPFMGQLGAMAAGMARMAQAFMGLGIASNTALGVVDIYEDPKMAPVAILGILMGFQGVRGTRKGSKEEMREMAKMRESISPAMIRNLGPVFERNEGLLQKISGPKACGF